MNPTLRAEANEEVKLEIIKNGGSAEEDEEEDEDDSNGTDSIELDAEDEHKNNNTLVTEPSTTELLGT